MPRIRSAKKQMRQSRVRRVANRTQRSALRTAIKRVRAATTAEDAQAAYKAVERLLDRAARKGLIHRNSAARHKSRLWKAISAKK
ncbi:MAG: 30S ribosomal protein S20 [Gemmatimonadetes bacterium]|nr:30S ribosomal protein S20 [Gemmatimonadota bacterium]